MGHQKETNGVSEGCDKQKDIRHRSERYAVDLISKDLIDGRNMSGDKDKILTGICKSETQCIYKYKNKKRRQYWIRVAKQLNQYIYGDYFTCPCKLLTQEDNIIRYFLMWLQNWGNSEA